jgi:hypothetical protein
MRRSLLAGAVVFAALAGTLNACGNSYAPPAAADLTDSSVGGSGGGDGASDGGRVRSLLLVTSAGPWQVGQSTAGMAVDTKGRVYIGDQDNVYVADGALVTTYLTAAEAASTSAAAGLLGFDDLDIASDDALYILSSGTVVRSRAAHQAEIWRDVSQIQQARHLGVIANDFVGLIGADGFWTSTPTATQLVYAAADIDDGIDCAKEDLAMGAAGMFLYQPGCNRYPLLRGQADGSGVEILYDTSLSQSNPVQASNFLCTARDPMGGFYSVIEDPTSTAAHLLHIADAAHGSIGLTAIETTPSFAEAAKSQHEQYAFRFCSLAVSGDGIVFFQTYSQLWKVLP